MTKSRRTFDHAALFLIGALFVFPSQDFSLHVDNAIEPMYPHDARGGGVAIILVEVDRSGKRITTETAHGEMPFSTSALKALTHWKFKPSSSDVSRTSITFIFRPRNVERVPLPVRITEKQKARLDRPPLPLEVFDPGYPPMCNAEGAVILELSVNERGEVDGVKSIAGIPRLMAAVEMEAKSWRFLPAVVAGKPVKGNAIAVISFVHPAL
jgi:outer membrane biosynthesis protein TonB